MGCQMSTLGMRSATLASTMAHGLLSLIHLARGGEKCGSASRSL